MERGWDEADRFGCPLDLYSRALGGHFGDDLEGLARCPWGSFVKAFGPPFGRPVNSKMWLRSSLLFTGGLCRGLYI